MMRWTHSLRNRLLFSITSVMIVGMLITSIISYRNSKEALQDVVGHEMKSTVEASRVQINSWVNDLQSDLRSWTYNPLVIDSLKNEGEPNTANALLSKLKQDYPAYENLGILNPQGMLIAGSNPAIVGKLKLDNRDYFKSAMAGQVAISKPVASRDTGEPIFVIAVPIREGTQTKGVLFSAINLSAFSQTFIDPLKIGEKGYAFVTDADGFLIAHPDKKRILKVNTRDYAIGKEMMKTENINEVISYGLAGEEKILVFTIDDKTGWTIGVTAEPDDIFASVVSVRNINFASAGILALLIAIILYVLISPIVSALKKGVDFAQAVKLGDTSLRLDLKRQDELGQLCIALNDMADSLNERSEVISQVADGDLRVNVSLHSEQDTLGKALVKMLANLNRMMSEVSTTGEQVTSGSIQISAAAQSLSQGGTESAASLEEISSSVGLLAAQSSSSAENAKEAKKLSTTAQGFADQGSRQMQEMVTAMEKIQKSSQNISKIIKTIDEIAFQTNLLALNAAVEAARAGQHGKGFAVVAEEVRNLAARSAKAAQETTELIESSVTLTTDGTIIAEQTSTELKNIVDGVDKVSALVADIAVVSEEQAEGISQVNIGLEQIDQAIQQNMAMAEESAASSEQLSSQSKHLQSMLQQFQLAEQELNPTPDSAPLQIA